MKFNNIAIHQIFTSCFNLGYSKTLLELIQDKLTARERPIASNFIPKLLFGFFCCPITLSSKCMPLEMLTSDLYLVSWIYLTEF